MTLVLMAVGLLAAAAGLVTIGFGIPINAFSLGNTLILAGTIAVTGGFVLIGLALVLGQLRRINEALRGKAPVRAAESTTAVSQLAPHVAPALAPIQHSVSEPQMAGPPSATEPRFPATASEPPPGPLDWLRAKSKPMASPGSPAEPPMVELTDEAPLSPRRPAMLTGLEAALDPKAWSPNRDGSAADLPPLPRSEQITRANPQAELPKEKFDLVWPDRGSAPALAPAPASAPPAGETKVEARPEIKREPALEMPLPPIPARPRETRPVAEKRMPEALRKPAERGPTILKSGVIDGMPYTLYADGSIEAQLPQGMVKFASVDALRAHLEKQS